MEFVAVKPCKFDAYEAVPKEKTLLDLDECERILEECGYERVSNAGVVLVVRKDGVEISLYPRGRLLMHPVFSKEAAAKTAKAVYACLGK